MAYELVNTTQLEEDLTSVADAIRNKVNSDNRLAFPQDFINELQDKEELVPLDVDIIDYDGTLLYTYTADDFLKLDSLPSNPSHKGLIAQGWNWTLADAKEYVAQYGTLVIGQSYTTNDGKTRLYITVTQDLVRLQCSFTIYLNAITSGTGTVDWGDNSTSKITSGTGAKSVSHIYSVKGNYIITITINSGTYALGYKGSNSALIDNPSSNSTSGKAAAMLKAVEIGTGIINFGRQPFRGATFLEYITIPTTLIGFQEPNTTSDGAVFVSVLLKGIVFPNGFQGKNVANIFSTMTSLRYISLPKTTTNFYINSTATSLRKFTMYSLENVATSTIKFNYSRYITHFSMPGTYTTLASVTCEGSMIEKVIIPATVTTIQTEAFMYNYFLKEIHVLPTSVPTLSNVRAFNGLASNAIIYVPYSEDHSILEAYKTATNWSTFASYMQEEPQL